MNAEVVVQRARELGITLRVDGGVIKYAPKSAAPPDFVEELRQHKPEVMAFLAKPQVNAPPKGYRVKYPDAQTSAQELEEIAARVKVEGYVLLWSTVLQDLVAFYRDEGAKSKIPPGFVPYSEAELKELFGDGKPPLATSNLRLIHEAKSMADALSKVSEQGTPWKRTRSELLHIMAP